MPHQQEAGAWTDATPGDVVLGDREVHIWTWQLEASDAEQASLEALLSDDERARKSRFRFEKDQLGYLVARGTLRRILGGYLALPPQSIQFQYSEFDKPSLAPETGTLEFNISHTRKLAAAACSRNIQVGIDIEAKNPIDLSLVQQLFSRREQDTLKSLDPDQRLDGFYNCWTRKEAISKAEGLGLNLAMSEFSVSLRPGETPSIQQSGSVLSHPWLLYDLSVGKDTAGALAVSEAPGKLSLFRIP